MATSSITKQIVISKKHKAQKFVDALTKAQYRKVKEVTLKKPCNDIKAEDIEKFSGA